MRAADNATKCREAADFDTPAPAGQYSSAHITVRTRAVFCGSAGSSEPPCSAGTSPSGSRTARRNFRVETLIVAKARQALPDDPKRAEEAIRRLLERVREK
jgi:hypothetical protein